MRRSETLERLRQILPELRRRFDVRELAVFGSVARDSAHAGSDLDVLVDFNGAARFDNFMAVREILEDTFGTRIDLVTRAALKEPLRTRIESEAERVT